MTERNGKPRFVMIPHTVIGMIRCIGATAYAVYSALVYHADAAGACWPSIETIASMIGASNRTARRALRRLVTAGLIEIEERIDGTRQLSNFYRILPSPQKPPDKIAPPDKCATPDKNDLTLRTNGPPHPGQNSTTNYTQRTKSRRRGGRRGNSGQSQYAGIPGGLVGLPEAPPATQETSDRGGTQSSTQQARAYGRQGRDRINQQNARTWVDGHFRGQQPKWKISKQCGRIWSDPRYPGLWRTRRDSVG